MQLNPLLKIRKNFTHMQQSKIYHSRKYLLNPRTLINTDSSVYSSEDTFEAESNGITLDENNTYYLHFKKINDVWTLDNYAIFNQFN